LSGVTGENLETMSHVSHQANSEVSAAERVYADDATSSSADATLGTLVSQLSTQIPNLIRSEIRLAQAEVTAKGKRAGIGIGMFSAAGLLAFFGLGFLLTTVALVLALVMDGWIATLIVTVVLFAVAGVAAMLGKKKVSQAAPLTPERTIESVKEDIATVKGEGR
jgi:uncharacterized membrane protein YqjE